jgi:hypothetical protein
MRDRRAQAFAATPALASSAWISARVMSDFHSRRPRINAA